MRPISYAHAIREAHAQLLASDPRVFVLGQGLWSPWYAGTSMQDLDREFGRDRVIDSPVAESATTGAAIGAADDGTLHTGERTDGLSLPGPVTRWTIISVLICGVAGCGD